MLIRRCRVIHSRLRFRKRARNGMVRRSLPWTLFLCDPLFLRVIIGSSSTLNSICVTTNYYCTRCNMNDGALFVVVAMMILLITIIYYYYVSSFSTISFLSSSTTSSYYYYYNIRLQCAAGA